MRLIRRGHQFAVHAFLGGIVEYLIFRAMDWVFGADLVLRVKRVS